MSIQEKVQAVLVDDAGVTAVVPAAQIKARDTDQQRLGPKYIIHEPAGGLIPTLTHDALQDLQHFPAYQVHCCARTLADANSAAAAVRSALGDYRGTDFRSMFDGQNAPDVDDERKVVMVTLDFDVWDGVSDDAA